MTKERVEFDLDKFIARIERQHVIEFSDVELLVVLLTETLARERRLRVACRTAIGYIKDGAPAAACDMLSAALEGEGEEQPT